ncbi:MAG: hypothetical protein ONB14_10025 [candidate division KSB1 bacterium]|nr:hypothetical protein [candidate division KSB1 bacterium]
MLCVSTLRRVGGLLMFLLAGAEAWHCAPPPRVPEVALVAFESGGQKYRLRSVYSPRGGESFNELIGPQCVVRDNDQDGVLDAIILGECSLAEVQRIYEEALSTLAAQNRLRQVEPVGRVFRHDTGRFSYQLKTVQAQGGRHVNEFVVTRSGSPFSPSLAVGLDEDADGFLDNLVKGTLPLSEVQRMYQECIELGVRQQRLVRMEGRVLVKQ